MSNNTQTRAASIGASHRRAVLQVMLGIIVLCGVLFLVLNWRRGNYTLMTAEALMMVYAGAILFILRHSANIRRWALAYLIPFFSAMLLACWLPQSSPAVFVWVVIVPVLSYLLLGRRLGLALTAVYVSGAGLIFIWKYTTGPIAYAPIAIIDMVLCAASVFVLSHVYEVIREQTENGLRELALHDPLTGMANRTRFDVVFERERQEFVRNQTPACLLLIDLDHFKRVNDTYGHGAGDQVLCFIAGLFERRLRATDMACRLGGEEFAVILANTLPRQAAQLAELLRAAVARQKCSYQDEYIDLTATIGVAELGHDGSDLQTLMACADCRLYEGKKQGRNCVVTC